MLAQERLGLETEMHSSMRARHQSVYPRKGISQYMKVKVWKVHQSVSSVYPESASVESTSRHESDQSVYAIKA